jgi:hypothetical protein
MNENPSQLFFYPSYVQIICSDYRVWIQPFRPGTSRTVSGFIAKETVQCCRVEKGLDCFSKFSANVFVALKLPKLILPGTWIGIDYCKE